MAVDLVLERDDGLSQCVDFVGLLLVEKVDLILELGEVSDLVHETIVLTDFVGQLLLQIMDEVILLLITQVELLYQEF